MVFNGAGGADMMRRYFDVFQTHGWASTLWAYKLIKAEGGVHPDHWYMVTNREPLTLPDFASASAGEVESVLPFARHDGIRAGVGPARGAGGENAAVP